MKSVSLHKQATSLLLSTIFTVAGSFSPAVESVSKENLILQAQLLVENLQNTPVNRIFSDRTHARVFRSYHRIVPEEFQSRQWAFKKTDSDLYVAPNNENFGFALRRDNVTNDMTGLIIEAVVPVDVFKMPPFTRIDLNKLPEQDIAPYVEKIGIVRVEAVDLKALVKRYGGLDRATRFIQKRIESGDTQFVAWFEVRRFAGSILSESEFMKLQQSWFRQLRSTEPD